MRPRTIRIIESIHSKGVFGPCSCGGEVLYYTDRGVRCSTCGKLYGVWANKQRVLVKRARELLLQSQGAADAGGGGLAKRREVADASDPKGMESFGEFVTAEEDVGLTV